MTIYNNFPLKEILYYKIGGRAKVVLKIESREDLAEALEFINKSKAKRILAVGLGSNLLVADSFFDGAVLWFAQPASSTLKINNDGLVEVFASETLDKLINFSFDNNLVGLEWAGGLPSTIGGSIRGNVGAFGGEIKDNLAKVKIFEINNGSLAQKDFSNSDLKFSYRSSLIKERKNLIISTAFFKLNPATKKEVEEARKKYLYYINYRNQKHPTNFPSCGSVFKNIREKEKVEKIISVWSDIQEQVKNNWYGKVSFGYITNRLGFSGFKIGNAEVSEKHANYIVNIGGAKFEDVLSIIEKIKDKFYEVFGFLPEIEVEIVS